MEEARRLDRARSLGASVYSDSDSDLVLPQEAQIEFEALMRDPKAYEAFLREQREYEAMREAQLKREYELQQAYEASQATKKGKERAITPPAPTTTTSVRPKRIGG